MFFSWERENYSLVNNTSTIKWSVSINAYGMSVSFDNKPIEVEIDGTTYTKYYSGFIKSEQGSVEIASGTATIKHNNDGSKTFFALAGLNMDILNGYWSVEGESSLERLGGTPARIINAPDFNDEENPVITITPPGNNTAEVWVVLTMVGDSTTERVIKIIKTHYDRSEMSNPYKYTISLTTDQKRAFRKCITSGYSKKITYELRTFLYKGEIEKIEEVQEYAYKTYTLIDAAPAFFPSIKDVGTHSSRLTGDPNGTLIKGYNFMEVDADAYARKEATIVSCNITCGNSRIDGETGTFNHVQSGTFVFTATDSRGNTTTETKTLKMVDYTLPSCYLNVEGVPYTENGIEYIEAKYTMYGLYFNDTFGAVHNTLKLQIRLKTNDGEWGEWGDADVSPTFGEGYSASGSLFGLSKSNYYSLQARVKDEITYATSSEVIVKTIVVFDWGKEDFRHNTDVILAKQKYIKTTDKNGDDISLFGVNSVENLLIGQGNYEKPNAGTYVMGNFVSVVGKGNVSLASGTGITLDGERFTGQKTKTLWEGASHMNGGHIFYFNQGETILNQRNGIVLSFTYYSNSEGAAKDWTFHNFFIPKEFINKKNGTNHTFEMFPGGVAPFGMEAASKTIYIFNDHITGHADNTKSGTAQNGMPFNSSCWVLRYVLGV